MKTLSEKGIQEKIIESATVFARGEMCDLQPSHGWDHVERVRKNALHIAETEPETDLFILEAAVILHDISRKEQDSAEGKICHAERGSVKARDFLIKEGLDAEISDRIARCILTHRFRNSHVPQTIEEKILYDADKLDSIGAVGIGRAFLFAGEVGARLHNPEVNILETESYSHEDTAYREFIFKLRKIKDKMLTREGKRIAEERHHFMEDFFARLTDEVLHGS